jgi:hypothetical protein
MFITFLILFYVVPPFLPPHLLQLRNRRRFAIRTAFDMLQESTEWSQRRIENPGLFGGRILLETPEQIVVQLDYRRLSERPGRRAWFGVTDAGVSTLTADECKSLGIDIPTWL